MSQSINANSPALNSATNVQTQSGNRVAIEFGGIQVGLLQSYRASEDYGHEPASGIGSAQVQEWVPGRAMYNINISKMTLITELLRSSGITATDSNDVLKGRVFDIVVYSKDSGAALRSWTQCSYVSGDVSVDAHRIVMTSAVFRGIGVTGQGL